MYLKIARGNDQGHLEASKLRKQITIFSIKNSRKYDHETWTSKALEIRCLYQAISPYIYSEILKFGLKLNANISAKMEPHNEFPYYR